MYLSYYDLTTRPFEISTDPDFLWLGEKHQEALATLRYGVLAQKGFLLLTGDVGTGKTTILNALLERLHEDVLVAKINDPDLGLLDMLNYIARLFGMEGKFHNKVDFLVDFSEFLNRSHQNNKILLLIIDEAHRLSVAQLEQLRLLSNIELARRKLINIFFVGQNELDKTLALGECRALRQRIALRYHIAPLARNETSHYIAHRLVIAGSTRNIFSKPAMAVIHRFSGGYPRLINILCDHALLTGFAQENKEISAAVVRECARELHFSGSTKELHYPDPAINSSQHREPIQPTPHASLIAPRKDRPQRLHRPVALLGVALVAACLVFLHPEKISPIATFKELPLPDSAASTLGSAAALSPHHGQEGGGAPKLGTEPEGKAKPSLPQQSTLEKARQALLDEEFGRAVALLEDLRPNSAASAQPLRELYAQALRGKAEMLVDADPKKAETLLGKALAYDPDNVKIHFSLGKLRIKQQNYPEAIQFFQKAALLAPQWPDPFFNLGFAYSHINEYDKAEAMFRQVVALRPAYLDKAWLNLAIVMEKQGKRAQSIEVLQAALKVNGDNDRANRYLAMLRQQEEGTY